jgi:5,10-methylenetetrahydromethanopterin reductase
MNAPKQHPRLGVLAYNLPSATTIDLAQTAERSGLASIWLPEDLWDRGAVPLAAACAQATTTLRIGIGVLNPFSRHPTQIAVDYGTLAELSGGRVVLGVGAGVEAWVTKMGLCYSRPRTSVVETVQIARQLLTGNACSFAGAVFSLDDVSLNFPVSGAPPIYIGATRERSLRSCGAIADGWVASVIEPLARIKRGIDLITEGAAEAGRALDDFEVVQFMHLSCDDNSAEARARLKPTLAHSMRGEIGLLAIGQLHQGRRDYLARVTSSEYENVLGRLRNGDKPEEAIPDELVDELAIAGTPEECAARIDQYRGIGVTEFAFLVATDDLLRSVELIGRNLLPAATREPSL